MCGCEQGLCPGNCACGCDHYWPPTQEQVQRLADEQRSAREGWYERVKVLMAENASLRSQVQSDQKQLDEAADVILDLRKKIAKDIWAAKPNHITRDYTDVDKAYDDCAHIALGDR
jgi:hypothetical protein